MGRPGLLGMAARTAVVAGTATAVAGGVSRHQQKKADEKAEAQAMEQQQAAAQYQQPQYQQPQYQQPQYQQPQYQPAPAAPAPVDTDKLIEQLRQLAELHDSGVLTDQEFAAQKARLLGT